jgi:hypothetical protein
LTTGLGLAATAGAVGAGVEGLATTADGFAGGQHGVELKRRLSNDCRGRGGGQQTQHD